LFVLVILRIDALFEGEIWEIQEWLGFEVGISSPIIFPSNFANNGRVRQNFRMMQKLSQNCPFFGDFENRCSCWTLNRVNSVIITVASNSVHNGRFSGENLNVKWSAAGPLIWRERPNHTDLLHLEPSSLALMEWMTHCRTIQENGSRERAKTKSKKLFDSGTVRWIDQYLHTWPWWNVNTIDYWHHVNQAWLHFF
jgi:hypothetical protein